MPKPDYMLGGAVVTVRLLLAELRLRHKHNFNFILSPDRDMFAMHIMQQGTKAGTALKKMETTNVERGFAEGKYVYYTKSTICRFLFR